MNLRQQLAVIMTGLMLCIPWGAQADIHSLKVSDVKPLMAELLDQHLGGQAVTTTILQDAVVHFLDRADNSHLYFLESESKPFLEVGDPSLQAALQQYQNQDYSLFIGLNSKLQQGIERARKLRSFSPATQAALFKEAARAMEGKDISFSYDPKGRAKNESELVERLKGSFVDYVADQMDRFGVPEVLAKQDVIAAKYEHSLQKEENGYLYLDDQGKALGAAGSDNLAALHILKALAKSLDAHTSFFDEGEAIDMKMRLEKGFIGIGIVVDEVIDGFVIKDLMADAPALRSGQIKINDRLAKVNGQSLLGMTLEEVTHLLHKEKAGDTIVLTVDRGGTSIDVSLKPEMIVVDQGRVETSFEKYGDGIIGTITLHSFYEGPKDVSAAQDVSNGIEKLRKEGKLVGLVLDLRDNSGGYLTQAVKVAGLFITNGVVVISKYSDGEVHYYRDLYGNKTYDGPLVVLTSRLTASAAEIVAQALQDYGVALVVGDSHTYGKGTIQAQNVTDDKSESYFKVTVGQFYTVSGRTTQLRGVEADVVLPGEYSQLRIGESYLNTTVADDVVPPAYKDNLADVESRAKQWYVDHYLPTIQPKETTWQALLPEIKRRSAQRIASDRSYQYFLKRLSDYSPVDKADAQVAAKMPQFDVEAYQVKEASHIVEDMLQLQTGLANSNGTSSISQDQGHSVGVRGTELNNR